MAYFSKNQSDLSKSDAIFYGVLVTGLKLTFCLYIHNCELAVIGFGIRVRTALSSLLYRKILKLNTIQSKLLIGKVVTLITNDVRSLEWFIYLGNDLWIAILKTIVVCCVLYVKIGVSAFVGVGIFLIVIPLQSKIFHFKMTLQDSF